MNITMKYNMKSMVIGKAKSRICFRFMGDLRGWILFNYTIYRVLDTPSTKKYMIECSFDYLIQYRIKHEIFNKNNFIGTDIDYS